MARGEGEQMEPTNIKPSRVQWRMLTEGALVWAPFGNHGWRAATVMGLGKNRSDRTVVHLAFETGGKGRRVAGRTLLAQARAQGPGQTESAAGDCMSYRECFTPSSTGSGTNAH